MTWRGHPYDATPHIGHVLDAITTAESFAFSYHDDFKPDYPSEVFARLRAARREVVAALKSAQETERQRQARATRAR